MAWRRLTPAAPAATEALLRRREEDCVAACARYVDGTIDRRHSWVDVDADGAIRSLLLVSGSVLYPLLEAYDEDTDCTAPERTPRHLPVKKHGLRSIQGLARDVAAAARSASDQGYPEPECRDYHLMALDGLPLPGALAAGPAALTIRRIAPTDPEAVTRLLPLQEAYEREEVLPAGTAFHAAACRLGLQKIQQSHILLQADLDGRTVAKANTNARGFTRDQIGGVYVLPGYRGRGIGTRLTAALAAELGTEARRAVLFVKKNNPAAIRAYEKVGFRVRDDYRICYYEPRREPVGLVDFGQSPTNSWRHSVLSGAPSGPVQGGRHDRDQ